jgi:hypothetical protein
MTTKDKIIDVETIDYVLNNMEYDWSEIEEELKEAIGLTLKFQNQKIIEEIEKFQKETGQLLIINSECKCRKLTDKYRGILDVKVRELLKTLGEKQ